MNCTLQVTYKYNVRAIVGEAFGELYEGDDYTSIE